MSSRGRPTRASPRQDPWPTCATTSMRWSRRWAAPWSCRSTTPGRPGVSPRPRCGQCSRTCWSGPRAWAGPGPSALGGWHGCPPTLQDVPWALDSGESPRPWSWDLHPPFPNTWVGGTLGNELEGQETGGRGLEHSGSPEAPGLRNRAVEAWRLQARGELECRGAGESGDIGTLGLGTLRRHSGLGGLCEAPGLGKLP